MAYRRVVRVPVLLTLVAAALVLLAGCASTTGGQGSVASGASVSSSSPDFPSTTAQPSTPSATTTGPSAGSSSATGSPSSTTSAAPSVEDRRRQLAAESGGGASVLVRVPGGYEAATYDQRGGIRFWSERDSARVWTPLGASRYPAAKALGAPHASAQGALLRRMRHATFIVHGIFTGDSSGNAVAYTTGSKGWGTIKAKHNGNIGPSGAPVGADRIGLSFDFAFRNGELQTKDCPTNRPIADCGRHPVTKLWVWTGSEFARA